MSAPSFPFKLLNHNSRTPGIVCTSKLELASVSPGRQTVPSEWQRNVMQCTKV